VSCNQAISVQSLDFWGRRGDMRAEDTVSWCEGYLVSCNQVNSAQSLDFWRRGVWGEGHEGRRHRQPSPRCFIGCSCRES